MTVLTPVARETVWGTNIVVEVSSAAPTADPVWVDISAWVMVPGGVTLETWIGRATELQSSEPGRFSLVLNNRDSRFTPGNTSSPYYPWFKQARRMRIREVVAWRAFDLMDGYIEIPDNLIVTEVVGEADSNITLAVSGLDRVGREANGRPFISTLAAHIMSAAPSSTLLHYWPLGDVTTTVRPAVGTTILRPRTYSIETPGDTTDDLLQPAAGVAMPGDDLTPMHWQTPGHISGTAFAGVIRDLYGSFDQQMNVDVGDVVTVSCWVRTEDCAGTDPDYLTGLTWHLGLGGIYELQHYDSLNNSAAPPSGFLGSEFFTLATDGGSVTAGGPNSYFTGGSPTLITLQVDVTSGDVSWWLNDQEVLQASTGGVPATPYSFDHLIIGTSVSGDICHMQIYQGAVGTFTRADHLAQVAVGLYGLERQTTGARINTIADYIGIPAAARDVDEGVALMSRVSLAGRTAADAWAEAVDTERGRLTTDAGRLVFHDRRRVYDV